MRVRWPPYLNSTHAREELSTRAKISLCKQLQLVCIGQVTVLVDFCSVYCVVTRDVALPAGYFNDVSSRPRKFERWRAWELARRERNT